MKGRILYLHPHFTLPGGAGRYALETGRVLAARGWEIHVASIAHKRELVAEYESSISFHTLGGPLSSSLWYWPHLPLLLRNVLRCIDTVGPTVVFSQVFPANWWGFIAKLVRGSALRHVWMCQEPSAFIHSTRWIDSLPRNVTGNAARFANPLLKLLDVRLGRYVDHVVANSQFSRSLALGVYSYPPERVAVSYPGVDIHRFCPSSTVERTRYSFVTCARLTKFKNIDKIILAIDQIRDLPVSLTVIGKGEEYEALVQLTHARKLQHRVSFLQTISDDQMISELRSSYGLIHAAEEEAFGLTAVEAMACGTPVIAIAGGGPAETVVHEQTGYLCPHADATTIAGAIRWLIAQEPRMAEVSAACVHRASRFTWEAAASALEGSLNDPFSSAQA